MDTAAVPPLRYLTEDYAPSNYVENGQLTGYAVDVLRAIWRRAGIAEQPIEVVPWARGYLSVQSEPQTVLFAMARTLEREQLFKWVGPIYQTDFQLVSLRQGVEPAPTLAKVLTQRLGAVRGDQGQALLERAGVPAQRLTLLNDPRALVRMLKVGRVEAVCLTSTGLAKAAAAHGLAVSDFVVISTLSSVGLYYAFHRDTPDNVVAVFQSTLNAMDAERRGILARYQLGP